MQQLQFESKSVIINMEATEQYSLVVPLIVLNKVALTVCGWNPKE